MITNEISKDFIYNKVKELSSGGNIATIKKIDDFFDNGLNQIVEELTKQLKEVRRNSLIEIEKAIAEKTNKVAELTNKIKDYEEDLTAIEKLKTFKRKSKVFN